jgi:ABC-type Mn2+/Zn2+ transport system permease subunit
MHKYIVYAAYGWLALSGSLHFAVDVVSQYLRGKREPSSETTLYYGLNSAFALGQVAFGLLGLFLAWRAMHLLTETPAVLLSIAVALGWLAITFLFMEYWEPKLNAAIFCVLIVAAFVTR